MKFNNIDLQGLGEIQNAKFQRLSSAPPNPTESQFYYNTKDHTLYVYDGTNWINALSQGGYTFQNGVIQPSGTMNVELNIATGANAGNVTLTADSNGLAGSVGAASTSAAGVIEIATDTEATTGTAENLAVNPKQLAAAVSGDIELTDLSIDSGSTNYLGYDNTTGKFSAKVDTTVGTVSTNLVTSGAVDTALSGKVDTNIAITGATKCKITYDSKGLVTAGADLEASDIPNLSLSKITDVTATASEVNVLDGVTVTTSDINSITSKIGLTDLSVDTGSTNYLGYDNTTGKFSAKVDTTVTANSTKLVTSGAVQTAISNAMVGGMVYKGVWTATNQTDYSSITLPVKAGYMYLVSGSATIGGIEWNTDDYLVINADVAAGGTITDVKKIDNTEGSDIVRLNTTQTLTNKTIDADNNTISDLTTSNLKSGVLQTTIRAVSSASDTAIPSEKAVASAIAGRKISVTNSALTVSGGLVTWTISNTIGTNEVNVQVYEVSSNTMVLPNEITVTASTITITMLASANVTAGTYRAVIIG